MGPRQRVGAEVGVGFDRRILRRLDAEALADRLVFAALEHRWLRLELPFPVHLLGQRLDIGCGHPLVEGAHGGLFRKRLNRLPVGPRHAAGQLSPGRRAPGAAGIASGLPMLAR